MLLVALIWIAAKVNGDCVVYPNLRTLVGHNEGVYSVAWSPDGHQFASGSLDNSTMLWDAVNGTTRVFPSSGAVRSVAWSPDGSQLAAGSDKSILLWDVTSGMLLRTIKNHAAILSVDWSPDGYQLVSGSGDNSVVIWDVMSGNLLHNLTGHNGIVSSVAWSPDGRQVASGSHDKLIKLWNVTSGAILDTLAGHNGAVVSVAWSPDGSRLASGSWDLTAKIWDSSSASLLHNLIGHVNEVTSVAWSPSGRQIASASYDTTVKLWDAGVGTTLRTFTGHSDLVSSVTWSPTGRQVVTGSFDSTLRLWHAATGSTQQTLTGHAQSVETVSWSPDSKHLVSGSRDFSLKVWDADSGETLRTLYTGEAIFTVAWSPDSAFIASGSENSSIILWDVLNGTAVRGFTGHNASILSVAFSPDGFQLASASADMSIKLWNVANASVQQTLRGHSKFVSSVVWSPDGHQLASGSDDNTIKLWDAATGLVLRTLHGHTDIVCSVAWSSDGRQLASGSADYSIKLWDVATGTLLRTLTGHRSQVRSVAFSPDGREVASGSYDFTVRIWDTVDGTLLRTLAGHSKGIFSLTWRPDGRMLASASWDMSIKVFYASWHLPLKNSQELDKVTFHLSGFALDNLTTAIQLENIITGECFHFPISPDIPKTVTLPPGAFKVAFNDWYQDVNPWADLTPILVNCPPGTQPNSSSLCEPCPANTFQAGYTLASCSACFGRVSAGRTVCNSCPLNAFKDPNISQCVCTPKFFRVASGEDDFTCEICPANAECADNHIKARDGFWRTNDEEFHVLPAVNQACQNGGCAYGYHGALCAECMPGYGQDSFNVCSECGAQSTNVFLFILVMLLLIVLCVVLARLSLNVNSLAPNVAASTLKVGISAAFINSLLLRLEISLPSWLIPPLRIIDWISGSAQYTNIFSCTYLDFGVAPGSVFFAQSRLTLFLPVGILGVFFVVLAVIHFLRLHRDPTFAETSKAQLKIWFLTGSTTVMFTFHPTIVLQTFRMFSCRAINKAHTEFRLSSDLTVVCGDEEHILHIIFVGVPMLIFYVILPPLAAFIYMRRLPKDQLLNIKHNKLLFLNQEFTAEYYWWFIVVIFRKVLAVILIIFSSGYIQLALMSFMVMCFLAAHLRSRPYIDHLRIVKLAESTSLFISGFVYSIAQLFQSSTSAADGAAIVIIFLLVLFYAVLFGIVCRRITISFRTKTQLSLQKTQDLSFD